MFPLTINVCDVGRQKTPLTILQSQAEQHLHLITTPEVAILKQYEINRPIVPQAIDTNMAGLLTYPGLIAPSQSIDTSGRLRINFCFKQVTAHITFETRITAAGTVEESHLIPF